MINDFFSGFSGTLNDQMKACYLANTTGTDASMTLNDLWGIFLTQRGYTEGTNNDRMRQFLLTYLLVSDTGQTIQDLWAQVTGPYVN